MLDRSLEAEFESYRKTLSTDEASQQARQPSAASIIEGVSKPLVRYWRAVAAARGPERLRGCRAAECGQQFPPSDGDCHTPLPPFTVLRTSAACSREA
jgi:hypothetical protein